MIGIRKEDFNKIIYFAKAAVEEYNGAEIGGMAILEQDDDEQWIIKHPTILKQVVTSSTCTLDKEALANYYTKSMMKYGTGIKFVWWHSHGNGSVFWSGTDETAIKEYKGGNWSVSLVVNAGAEYRLRIDYWQPLPAKLDKQELDFIGNKEEKIPASISNKVKKLVEEETSTVTHIGNGKQTSLISHYGYGSYGNYNGVYDGPYYSYNSIPTEFNNLGLGYWQKQALVKAQRDVEGYLKGMISYLDLKSTVDDTNEELDPKHNITLPTKKKLKKLFKDADNVSIVKLFKGGN